MSYLFSPSDNFNGWEIKKPLGNGGFGEVYLIENKNQKIAALKVFTHPELNYEDLSSELLTMGLFNNKPYFVKLYDADLFGEYPHIIMEYMPKGDLRKYLFKNPDISTKLIANIVVTISFALIDMQEHGIIHRDISPENIFFDSDMQVKLGDMGAALNVNHLSQPRMGYKIPYAAPEVLNGSYSIYSDIYSLGVVFFELCGGNPIKGVDEESINALHTSAHFKKLIKKMCSHKPNLRLKPIEIKNQLINYAMLVWKSGTIYLSEETSQNFIKPSPDLIYSKDFLREQRLIDTKELWKQQEKSILEKFNKYFQNVLIFSFNLCLIQTPKKRSNCFLGLEHILWTLLDIDSILKKSLKTIGLSEQDITQLKEEILSYIQIIEFYPMNHFISKRLQNIFSELKKSNTKEISEKEFLICLLKNKNTFFYSLLNLKRISVDNFIKEVKENEI